MGNMSVKKHLPLLDRKTFMHKDEMAMLYGKGGFSGLNCRGGIRQFGVPHKVVEAIETLNWSDGMWQIGDGNYEELKKEICQFWSGLIKLDQACIKVGHGSMQVLERINKMFLNEEASVVGVAPQFIEYVTEVLMTGAKYRAASLKFDDYLSFNVDSVLREITSADTLVYIDNPYNPTGQLIGLA
jgi:histidinol-phosphate aminotransferase